MFFHHHDRRSQSKGAIAKMAALAEIVPFRIIKSVSGGFTGNLII